MSGKTLTTTHECTFKQCCCFVTKCCCQCVLIIAIIPVAIILNQLIDEHNNTIIQPPIVYEWWKHLESPNKQPSTNSSHSDNTIVFNKTQLFVLFSDPNKNTTNLESLCHTCIMFYTLNNSDPRKYGTPYNERVEEGIAIYLDTKKPVTLKAATGKLGFMDRIFWSDIITYTLMNDGYHGYLYDTNNDDNDHYNHIQQQQQNEITKKNATNQHIGGINLRNGMLRAPELIYGTHIDSTKTLKIIVRVWPIQMNNIYIKCVADVHPHNKRLKDISSFWKSNKRVSLTKKIQNNNLNNIYTPSSGYILGLTFVDLIFDASSKHAPLINWRSPIWFKCATSLKNSAWTSLHPNHSSLLATTKPPHTQFVLSDSQMPSKRDRRRDFQTKENKFEHDYHDKIKYDGETNYNIDMSQEEFEQYLTQQMMQQL